MIYSGFKALGLLCARATLPTGMLQQISNGIYRIIQGKTTYATQLELHRVSRSVWFIMYRRLDAQKGAPTITSKPSQKLYQNPRWNP